LHAIRIVLGTMQPMLHDIVWEVLARQPDMEIVDETRTDDELLQVLANETADVVVMQLAGDAKPVAGAFLERERTAATVLCLSTDGRSAAVYEVRSRMMTEIELSPEGLRDSIRRACAARA
jgi:DNA-binding NarL/FixJ family response regulator